MLTHPLFEKVSRPIFIIGSPRSGTSITTWFLGQLPNVQPMPETGWIASLAVGGYLSHTYGSSRGKFSHLSNANYEAAYFMRRLGEAVDAIVHDCFKERVYRMYEHKNAKGGLDPNPDTQRQFQLRRHASDPKQRWIDGTPFNTYFIWAFATMFPEARFIHNLRDPADVATSLEGFDKFGHASVELEEGLRVWASHSEAAALGERALGKDKVFRLHFERISSEPEQLVRELCAFLDEEYSADCLLPLTKRINSSDVDERREENARKLGDLQTYQDCAALYADMMQRPPSVEPDPSAMETLRERFLEYCKHHPLI
jgi:hypothetical protein